DRREHTLRDQHAQLEQEWRNARLWLHELEEEMAERQELLRSREAELTHRIQSCESLVSDLEEQERALLALRDQMSADRATLRGDVDRELAVERQALEQTRQALEAERRTLAQEIERTRR